MDIRLPVKPFQETLHAGYCGPASLKIVFTFYGVEVTEEVLAYKTGATKKLGVCAEKIQAAAEGYGFSVEIQNACTLRDIERWLGKEVPVIVDWFTIGRDDYAADERSADGHYSVVSGIDDTYIFLQDPELGAERKMKREVFERVWFDFSGELIQPENLIVRQLIAIYR